MNGKKSMGISPNVLKNIELFSDQNLSGLGYSFYELIAHIVKIKQCIDITNINDPDLQTVYEGVRSFFDGNADLQTLYTALATLTEQSDITAIGQLKQQLLTFITTEQLCSEILSASLRADIVIEGMLDTLHPLVAGSMVAAPAPLVVTVQPPQPLATGPMAVSPVLGAAPVQPHPLAAGSIAAAPAPLVAPVQPHPLVAGSMVAAPAPLVVTVQPPQPLATGPMAVSPVLGVAPVQPHPLAARSMAPSALGVTTIAPQPSVAAAMPRAPAATILDPSSDPQVFTKVLEELSSIQDEYLAAISFDPNAIPELKQKLSALGEFLVAKVNTTAQELVAQQEEILQKIKELAQAIETGVAPPADGLSAIQEEVEQSESRKLLNLIMDKAYAENLTADDMSKILPFLSGSSILSKYISEALQIAKLTGDSRAIKEQKRLLTDEIKSSKISVEERKIIKEAAIALGLVEKSLADRGLKLSNTKDFENQQLIDQLTINHGKKIVPDVVYFDFIETLGSLEHLTADKRYSAIKKLNYILNYPGYAKPDEREEEINRLITTPGYETETDQSASARLLSIATKHVKKCFEKKGLVGDAMEEIENQTIEMLYTELLARRTHIQENPGYLTNKIPLPKHVTQPICLRGPAGTGKTSVATVINESLFKLTSEQAVAGEDDVTAIFGRGQNWSDPSPGLISLAMIMSHSSRVGIFLDELEKADPRFVNSLGNYLEADGFASGFRDDYFNSRKDLKPGSVSFIAAVNYWHLLPDHIKSRFKSIDVPASDLQGKIKIVKRLKERSDVFKDGVEFSDENIKFFIQNYSDQPGNREVVAMFRLIESKVRIEKGKTSSPYRQGNKIVVNEQFIINTMEGGNYKSLTKEQQQVTELQAQLDRVQRSLYRKEEELIKLRQAKGDLIAINQLEQDLLQIKTQIVALGNPLLSFCKTITDPNYIKRHNLGEGSDYIKSLKGSMNGLEETIFLYKQDYLEAELKKPGVDTEELNKQLIECKIELNESRIQKVQTLFESLSNKLRNVKLKDGDKADELSKLHKILYKELKDLRRTKNTLDIAKGLQNDGLKAVKIIDISSKKNLTASLGKGSKEHFEAMYQHLDKSLSKYYKYLGTELAIIKPLAAGNDLKDIESNASIEKLKADIKELEELTSRLIDKYLSRLETDLATAMEAGNDIKTAEIKQKIAELNEKKLELAGNISGAAAKRADGGLSPDHRHEDKTATRASQSDSDAGGGLSSSAYPASQALGSNVLSAFNTGEPQKPLGLWARFKNWVKRLFGFGKSSSGANQGAGATNAGSPGSSQFGITHPLSSSMLGYNADNTGVGYGAESKGTSLTFTPSAMLSAAKHQHAGNVGMVANGHINSADFKKFTQEEIANAKELKQVFKALQDAKDPSIIKKLQDIQVKFDYINQRKADPSNPLQKGSPEKNKLKAELQKEIQDLKKLLEKNQITALNQIAKTLTKFSQHTSSKTAQLSLTAFYGQLNALNLYKDLDVFEENGALVVRDQQKKLIEAQLRGESLHVSSSQNDPSIASIVQMVIYALQGSKNTGAGFTITNCEACPKVALYLYLFSRAVDLSPKLSEQDNTKQAVDKYIAENQNTPELKPLINLYTSIKDNPQKLSKEILLALRKWEKDFYHSDTTIELRAPHKNNDFFIDNISYINIRYYSDYKLF